MTIVIVEDMPLMAEIFRKHCAGQPGCTVVGAAVNGDAAVTLIAREKPDLVVLDLMLPDLDGFDVVKSVRNLGYRPKVLAISSRCDSHTVHEVEKAEFEGFIHKHDFSESELRRALRVIAAGQPYFSRAFEHERRELRRDPQAFDKLLTRKQERVLSLLGDSLADEDIARNIGVSAHAVRKQRSRILRKLGLMSFRDLLRYARERGFISFLSSKIPTDDDVDMRLQ
jgi:DNA-binding NarL/FixJ family response regulator